MIDNTTTCNECGQLRSIIANDDNTVDIGPINENFALCCGRLEKIESQLSAMFNDDGNLDMAKKCITNLGDCCDDPTSVITKDYLETAIRMMVAKLVIEMVSNPAKYLQYSGVKFYSKDGAPLTGEF